MVAISQLGETADTLAALRLLKEKNSLTLGIVNIIGSTIARETDAGVYNHAGLEIGAAFYLATYSFSVFSAVFGTTAETFEI